MLDRQRTQFFRIFLVGKGLQESGFEFSNGHCSSSNFYKNPRKDHKTQQLQCSLIIYDSPMATKNIAEQTKGTIKNLIYLSREKGNSLDLKIQFIRLQ
jgi:hypothetical protein